MSDTKQTRENAQPAEGDSVETLVRLQYIMTHSTDEGYSIWEAMDGGAIQLCDPKGEIISIVDTETKEVFHP